jgi:hypothetical protein
MRGAVIDPLRRLVEERDIASSKSAFQRIIEGRVEFCTWIGAGALYVNDWPARNEYFVIAGTHWIFGCGVVAGAGTGAFSLRMPQIGDLDGIRKLVRLETASPWDLRHPAKCQFASSLGSHDEIFLRKALRGRFRSGR